jgi:hypothetical protein
MLELGPVLQEAELEEAKRSVQAMYFRMALEHFGWAWISCEHQDSKDADKDHPSLAAATQ